jgi:hypothetical protein
VIVAVFVDELDLADADLLVDARTFLRSRLRGSDWATNDAFLLYRCDKPTIARTAIAKPRPRRTRRLQKIGSFIVQVNDNAAACPCTSRSFAAKHLTVSGLACAPDFASD